MISLFRIIFVAALLTSDLYAVSQEHMSSVYFYRTFDAMTVSHNFKLKINKEEVTKLFHNEAFHISLSPGTHTFQTSVGFSIGLPNVTGFNGARKFKKKFNLQAGHYYFKPAFLGGRHEVVEITQLEYEGLTSLDRFPADERLAEPDSSEQRV